MNQHRKKMVAPIIVTVIMVLYYGVYFGFLMSLLDGVWKYALGIFPAAFSAVTITVCTSGYFSVSQFFASSGQNIGVSEIVLKMNIQG